MLRTVSLSIWLVSAVAIFALVFQPVGAGTQMLVSVLTIAFLFVITRFRDYRLLLLQIETQGLPPFSLLR
jgi:hypothetical protein